MLFFRKFCVRSKWIIPFCKAAKLMILIFLQEKILAKNKNGKEVERMLSLTGLFHIFLFVYYFPDTLNTFVSSPCLVQPLSNASKIY